MFEVVVRPVVLPNIRPIAKRVLSAKDDPEKGKATIGGGGGGLLGASLSWSASVTRQMPEEESKRVVDEERVYQVDKQGNVNKQNYIDVERVKKVRLEGGDEGDAVRILYADPPKRDNVEILNTDVLRESSPS
jgi:hypothetical protein